ncbi:MAG: 16S rRNA (uracil(1498)-N(3))-methyltransferase [Syntrophobacterales bacterium]|jgi:16S rRNA (uracil1498-N3)-methyltransferase|nr:16S rRNA (uracil(1498)-N(3))-methyltransferase [Syntrophobacterales bacterium]
MEIRRIFVDKLEMNNGLALLTGPMRKYIVTVLRKTAGERIDLVDGNGCLYCCVVNAIKGKELYLNVLDIEHKAEEKRPGVTLCASPIRGPRMDWLVEKATELRVDRIVPTIFKRSVVRPKEKEKEKYERWKRIAIEASRQSGRFSIPEVTEPTPLRDIIPHVAQAGNRWVFYEKEKETTMKDLVSTQRDGEICVAVGPEGGIEEFEVEWLKENGFSTCTLGESIFRSETTPLVVLSIILHEYSKR